MDGLSGCGMISYDGAAWAQGYKKDAAYVEWFDAAVAANPAVGPKATA